MFLDENLQNFLRLLINQTIPMPTPAPKRVLSKTDIAEGPSDMSDSLPLYPASNEKFSIIELKTGRLAEPACWF
jgi:hypothetical protein